MPKKSGNCDSGPVFGRLVDGAVVAFGVVVEAEDVTVTGWVVVLFVLDELLDELESAEVLFEGTVCVVVVVSTLSLPLSLLYAHRVPIKIPKRSPPTVKMPITVISAAAGRLTASVARI